MSEDPAASRAAPLDPGPAPVSPNPQLPQTGDEALDAALAELARAADLPLEAQVQTYVGVHRALQSRLADLEG